jgi:hypothetical protein
MFPKIHPLAVAGVAGLSARLRPRRLRRDRVSTASHERTPAGGRRSGPPPQRPQRRCAGLAATPVPWGGNRTPARRRALRAGARWPSACAHGGRSFVAVRAVDQAGFAENREIRLAPMTSRLFEPAADNPHYFAVWSRGGSPLLRATNAPPDLRLPVRTGSALAPGESHPWAAARGLPVHRDRRVRPGGTIHRGRPRGLAAVRLAAGGLRRRGARLGAGRRLVADPPCASPGRGHQRRRQPHRRRQSRGADQHRRDRQRTGPARGRLERHFHPAGNRLCPAAAIHRRRLARVAHPAGRADLGSPDHAGSRTQRRRVPRNRRGQPRGRPANAPPRRVPAGAGPLRRRPGMPGA